MSISPPVVSGENALNAAVAEVCPLPPLTIAMMPLTPAAVPALLAVLDEAANAAVPAALAVLTVAHVRFPFGPIAFAHTPAAHAFGVLANCTAVVEAVAKDAVPEIAAYAAVPAILAVVTKPAVPA